MRTCPVHTTPGREEGRARHGSLRRACGARRLVSYVLAPSTLAAVPAAWVHQPRRTCPPLLPRRLGALSGILATLTFPPLHRWLGLVPVGAAAIWLQLACLVGGAAPAVAAAAGAPVGNGARVHALVWGLVLSRYGLWTYDLAANQLVQETAEHASLGAVNGVQGSLQSLAQMGAYLAGLLHPDTSQFPWLMAASCCVVGVAAALVTAFAARTGCGRRLPALQPQPVP